MAGGGERPALVILCSLCPLQAWFYHRQAGRSGGVGGRWQPATINDAYSPPQNTNNAESLQPDHLKHNSFSPRTSGTGRKGLNVY